MKRVLLLLWLIPTASHAEKIGRLFFTPQQREAMDSRHRKSGPAQPEGQAEAAGSLEAKGGGKTIWVDGIPRQVEPGKKK